MQRVEDFIFGGHRWCDEVVRAKFDGITNYDGARFTREDFITLVVLEGRSNVESIMCTVIPRSADGGFVVDLHGASCWRKGCGIKVELPEEGLPGR